MFNRKLKKRVQQLEDYLGVVYSTEEQYHVADSYSKIKSLDDNITEIMKKLKMEKKSRFYDL